MHLKSTELNTKATFTNHSTQIYLINTSIVKIFFKRFWIARKNKKCAHLFIRNNIPFHTRIRGRIIYHAYINKLTPPKYKPYFNNQTKTHELKTPNKHNAWFHSSIPILPSDISKWKLSYETHLSSKPNTSTRLNPSQITADHLPSQIITDPVLSQNATKPLPSQTTTDPLLSQDTTDHLSSPLQYNNSA